MLSNLLGAGCASVLALALGGCLNERASLVDGSLAEAEPQELGHIAGSIGVWPTGLRYSRYTVVVCDLRQEPVMEFEYWQSDMMFGHTPDIEEADMEGVSFSLAMPEGQYSFCDFRLFRNGAYAQTSVSAKERFAVPFSIEAGTLTYVGEFRSVPVEGRNIFGLPIAVGGYWVISDRRERDIPLVLAKAPELARRPVVNGVPDVAKYDNPLLRSDVGLPSADPD